MPRRWFRQGVMKRPPNDLGGWKKSQAPATRRRLALESRPKNWTLQRRRTSAGRALMALSNVTQDNPTRMRARADARYFFRKR